MKKVFFAIFAGACVMTSIMGTAYVNNTSSSKPVSHVLRDTVPPKDTSKIFSLAVIRDTVPPTDTTTKKIIDLAVLRDTVPPQDTTKKIIYLAALRDTVPPQDTTKKIIYLAALRDTVPPKDTTKILELLAYHRRDTVPGKKRDTSHKPTDTSSMPRITDVAIR